MEGVHLVQHLMQDDSYGPNVTLDGVARHPGKRKVNLGRHSIRRPASPALHLQLTAQTLRKPEIRNLDLAILDQDVLKLKVPVDDIARLQHVHALHQLFEIFERHLDFEITRYQFLPQVLLAEL
jgi:hypothetical protein